jgi:ABC-type nitrate/sulfonate/bicarbonate transport system ATPase subunit
MHKRPAELSQGMRQRVGIARALERDQKTAFMVTHDVDEAIYLADRVVMMTNGPDRRGRRYIRCTISRPRDRKEIMEHPDYYRLREYLIIFLEERAEKKREIAADTPPHVVARRSAFASG